MMEKSMGNTQGNGVASLKAPQRVYLRLIFKNRGTGKA